MFLIYLAYPRNFSAQHKLQQVYDDKYHILVKNKTIKKLMRMDQNIGLISSDESK